MTAVLEKPDAAPARSLESLSVSVNFGEIDVEREVYPIGDATIADIAAAMKSDGDFLNPLVKDGTLTKPEGRKLVVLAHWTTSESYCWECGDITEVTAHFDDETSEEITV